MKPTREKDKRRQERVSGAGVTGGVAGAGGGADETDVVGTSRPNTPATGSSVGPAEGAPGGGVTGSKGGRVGGKNERDTTAFGLEDEE
jgi:hypothetical protein